MSRILLFGLLLVGVAVLAGTRPTSEPQVVHAAAQTFNPTGAMQTFNVPAGVTQVRIEVRGADGGAGGAAAAGCVAPIGGQGGRISGILTLPPGTTQLFVFVGTNGGTPGPAGGATGGFNGGGPGGNNTGGVGAHFNGGGGGGATDVRTNAASLASRLITAGGGGGGGGCSGDPVTSNNNGGIGGFPGTDVLVGCTQGGNGTLAAPGQGGQCGALGGLGGAGALPGINGSAGQGGAGGSSGGGAGCGCGGQGGGGGGGQIGGGGGGGTENDGIGGGGGGGGGGANFIAAGGTASTGNTLATAGAIITVLDPPAIAKSFSPTSVPINGLTDLTITLTNNNPAGPFSTLTGISFTDNFAAQGLVINTGAVFGAPLCAGTITANAGTSVISLTNGTLTAGASCQIRVAVRATLGGTQVNTTGPVSAAESGPGGTATAPLAVASTIPSVVKTFNPTSVVVGNTSTLTLTLTNPNIVGMTGVVLTDNFAPQGLVITSAAPTGTPLCTGTITATTGTSLISLTGGTLAANASCQIVVTVRANTVGNQVNTTSTLVSNEFAPGAAASAPLAVTALATPVPPTPVPPTPVIVLVPPPVIPQVFQHVPQGIFNGTRNNTPTPVVRALAPSVQIDPGGIVVLRPPSTGDAGLTTALRLPFDW